MVGGSAGNSSAFFQAWLEAFFPKMERSVHQLHLGLTPPYSPLMGAQVWHGDYSSASGKEPGVLSKLGEAERTALPSVGILNMHSLCLYGHVFFILVVKPGRASMEDHVDDVREG